MNLSHREPQGQFDKRAAKAWFKMRAIQRLVQRKLSRPGKSRDARKVVISN